MPDTGKIITFASAFGGGASEAEIEELKSAIAKSDGFVDANNLGAECVNHLGLPFDINDVVKFAIIKSDGSIRNTGNNNDRNYSVTPPIPVEAGKYALYVPSGKGTSSKGQLSTTNNGYGLFGSDGTTPVAKVSFESIQSNIFQITVPSNAKFIRFVFYHGPANDNVFSEKNVLSGLLYVNANWSMIKSDSTTLTSADFPRLENGRIDKLKRADGSYYRIDTNELHTKKILVFGDSIWGNDRTDGISDFLAEYCGATIYNCAIGGTWINNGRDAYSRPEYSPFDGINLVHAKMTDTWTDQDANASSVLDYVATQTLPLLKSVDMSKVDIIILAYGTNDFTANRTIANTQAAYQTVTHEIWTTYPGIRFIIITPPWRMIETDDADTFENSNGDTLREFSDGIIEKANALHITTLDMLKECPWNAKTKTYYMDADGTHPGIYGNEIYAHIVNGKLQTLY